MSAPAHAGLLRLARPEIVELAAYEHAAWEPGLERLHANELPWRIGGDGTEAGLNRYPEPQPRQLIERLASLYSTEPERVLVCRGSDEAIDLLVRAFCRPGCDSICICPPTFGMYAVAARIQGAAVMRVPLERAHGFALQARALLERCGGAADGGRGDLKLVFVCSPNNPTGNLLEEAELVRLGAALEGRALLVVDEAYIEFAQAASLVRHAATLPNLVVLRTLSKAYGLAGARCGALLAAPELVRLLRKIIPPYALTQHSIETVLSLTEPAPLAAARERVAAIIRARSELQQSLAQCPGVAQVWPSAANFLLVEFHDATRVFEALHRSGLLVRDVRSQPALERALRITVGTAEQNARLLAVVRAAGGGGRV